ncbi:MAG TPA: YqeG family HAD IIIA-type phosphatase [Firmicutes bacterium]|nr:YqeG family HAD IIIA-type phosphatase [Bacillota bacterium]
MKMLVPDAICESVFAIELDKLKSLGISGLLIDIDNTLVPWGEPKMQEAFVAWVKRAKQEGFRLCLVSNAIQERAQSFATLLGIPAVGRALKPLGRAFRRGAVALGLSPKEVAVVGDQLFTDVFGGNRLGIYTILINPLSERELGTTRLVRKMERKVLEKMVKQGHVSVESLQIRRGGN